MKKKKTVHKVILMVIGFLLALIFISPILILVNSSFKSLQEIYLDILALPKRFSFQNYVKAFEQMDFLKSLINSLVITCVSTVLIILISSMAAWVLVRYKTKTSKVLFLVFAVAQLIPFQCVMLPLVNVMSKLHLMNRPDWSLCIWDLDAQCPLFFSMVSLRIFRWNLRKQQPLTDVICFRRFSLL